MQAAFAIERAHRCLQKADIILIWLIQAANQLLQSWNDLNLHVLQVIFTLSPGEMS